MTKRNAFITISVMLSVVFLLSASVMAKKKAKSHPFDLFTEDIHQMHTEGFFEGNDDIKCETCHKRDDSYERGARKVYPLGCHLCHNSKKPIVDATQDCNLCHSDGFPKPKSHRAGWDRKHQTYAKQNPKYCVQCHENQMFCIECHKKRETVEQKKHTRNFKFTHSIKARANPRRCSSCHTVSYCQECHAGRETSKR